MPMVEISMNELGGGRGGGGGGVACLLLTAVTMWIVVFDLSQDDCSLHNLRFNEIWDNSLKHNGGCNMGLGLLFYGSKTCFLHVSII